MASPLVNTEVKERMLSVCRELASSKEIVASCVYGPQVYGYTEKGGTLNVLLVLKSPRSHLKSFRKQLNGVEVSFLVVDQETFEKDVEGGWLGELIAENLITPYEVLTNEAYLLSQEVKAKKRMVSELIGNLIFEFPELSFDILIRPEYFIFETMARRASLFPPVVYSYLKMLGDDLKEKNVRLMMKGFTLALDELAKEGQIDLSDGYVKIEKDHIEAIKRKKPSIKGLLRTVRRETLRQILRVFPKTMSSLLEYEEVYAKLSLGLKRILEEPMLKLEDSKRYLLVPTPLGFVTLSDKTTIEDFVKKTVPQGGAIEMDAKKIGGVLNSVYLLRYQGENRKQKVVVKLFKDWYGLKWFPLALWALGTQEFSVLGKSRLEKEYAVNRLLLTQGIRVPEILYVSPEERLIFEEFVEGVDLADILKRFASEKMSSDELKEIIKGIGGTIAKIHEIGVALGDCKPENMVITPKGDVCFLDLEQASRGGDQAWDIAEFLFYAGHYFPLFSSLEDAKTMTSEFVEGYLEAGGDLENIRRAGSARYVKVFSFFTPPHVLVAILSACKKTLRTRSNRLHDRDQERREPQ